MVFSNFNPIHIHKAYLQQTHLSITAIITAARKRFQEISTPKLFTYC
jgi:hypothetical protein